MTENSSVCCVHLSSAVSWPGDLASIPVLCNERTLVIGIPQELFRDLAWAPPLAPLIRLRAGASASGLGTTPR